MSRLRFLAAILCLGLPLIIWGCGSDSEFDTGPEGQQGGGGDQVAAVAPELLGSARGRLLGNGTLAREVRLQGAGPLVGRRVEIDDPLLGLQAVNTDANGNFFFPQLTAGEQTLRIPTNGTTLPITVFGGAEIQLRSYPITRQAALDAVQQRLDSRPDFEQDEAFIIAPHNPIPAGASLTQALGTEDPEVDPTPPQTVLTTPQWLIYVDPSPTVGFHHRVLYFLVDAQTGEVTLQDRTAYPQLNGVSYYQRAEDHLENTALVDSPVIAAEEPRSRKTESQESPELTTVSAQSDGPKTFVFIIDGHDTFSSAADIRKFRNDILPNLVGLPPVAEIVEFKSIVESQRRQSNSDTGEDTTLRDELVRQFEALCAKTSPEDTFLMYITSHGNKSGPILNGTKSAIFSLTDKGAARADADAVLMWNVFNFGNCQACQVLVITEACHAGSMFERNDRPTFRNLDRSGRRYVLIASAQLEGPVEGNSVAIPPYVLEEEIGGLYTTYFSDEILESTETELFAQLEGAHARTKAILIDIVFRARASTTQKARNMNPLIFVDRAEGESCPGLTDPSPSPSPTPPSDPSFGLSDFQNGDQGTFASNGAFRFDHVVGFDSVPVSLGRFTVTNNGQTTTSVGLQAGSHVTVRTGSGQPAIDLDFELERGQSQVVEVLFLGTTTNSFSSPLTVVGRSGGTTTTQTIAVEGNLIPALEITPQNLSDTHTVSVTPCPDPIGSITVTNNCPQARTFRIIPQGLPIFTQPDTGTIAANSSLTVDVFFDCSTQTSFSEVGTVILDGLPEADALQVPAEESFTVDMTIVP